MKDLGNKYYRNLLMRYMTGTDTLIATKEKVPIFEKLADFNVCYRGEELRNELTIKEVDDLISSRITSILTLIKSDKKYIYYFPEYGDEFFQYEIVPKGYSEFEDKEVKTHMTFDELEETVE